MTGRQLQRGTSEWDAAWNALACAPINRGLVNRTAARDPATGEVWQYVGTADGWHEFRHRHHPAVGGRVVVRLQL